MVRYRAEDTKGQLYALGNKMCAWQTTARTSGDLSTASDINGRHTSSTAQKNRHFTHHYTQVANRLF